MTNIITSAALLLAFGIFAARPLTIAEEQLHAGAFVQDITAPFDSLIINGGFTEHKRGKMNPGDLKARCFVLQKGGATIAIAVVDSCMMPRTVCDLAKELTTKVTGIPPERILITATHTHSAPSTMDYCLGTMADPRYTKFLPPKIAAGIRQAHAQLEPARVGWNQVRAPGFTHCRRWITRPDKMQSDPFGNRTVRAMMHPGYQNPAYIGPSGPADDELSVLSIQTLEGKPLAVLANFSMHFFGGSPADYFGLFSDRLAKKLGNDEHAPVCAMSQGTSGDLHWMDYSQPNKGRNLSEYADGLVAIAEQALEKVDYHETPPLAMVERTLTLPRRLPDAKRLDWADAILQKMEGRRPKNLTEVYAEQARYIHENPNEKLVLQALRIGDLAITAIPNEVYSITGLKLKAQSPFPNTFNIELANGAAGYIPPPHQHDLGGYTTWPARTAGLEVEAEPKIVETLLSSLESLAGKPRREQIASVGAYAQAILAEKPLAFWRCEEFGGGMLKDLTGHGRDGKIEGPIAYHLPGPDHASFSGEAVNRSLQLVGGTVSAEIPGARSLSFWFWNGLDSKVRENSGDLLQLGEALRLRIGGNGDGASRGKLILQGGERMFNGSSQTALRGWHHVVISHDVTTMRVFLDGNSKPEVQAEVSGNQIASWRFGGQLPFEGRIDEAAWFAKTLTGGDAKRFYTVSGMTPPPQPPPAPPKFDRGPTDDYAKSVTASKPVAIWRRRDSAEGRLSAEVENIGDTYSVSFWFHNNLPNHSRPVTGYLFSRGIDGLKTADGDSLGIGGTHAAAGRLIVYHGNSTQRLLSGKIELQPEGWHHVAMVREGERIRVYLNGNPKPEIDGKLPRSYPEGHPEFFCGGRNDNFSNLQGKLDEVALYDRALTPQEITAHFATVKRTPIAAVPEEIPQGLAPDKAVKKIHVPKGYRVQLIAAEPLTQDPVAIDWGADGKLWVAEMADYPIGIDGKLGGRVRYLEDLDGDGVYDKSTLFLEGLNYPSGVLSWRNGVLVTAAPDIFYAEDTDGDGRADKRTVLFTGFKQGNQQLRVNGLRWGLDNWVHGANGSHHARYAAGVKITSPVSGQAFELGSLDFRIRPDEGLMVPLSGPSQFGRSRDDWGNWFGLQNSYPIWHYVLEHRYLNRNPSFAPPDPRRILTEQNPRVFPAKAPQKRFHSFKQSGRYTSACAPMIYRDSLLFDEPDTFTFTCEPFHNLVQRMSLTRNSSSFTARRIEGDGELDFFASEDRWCRPVMARTGPDGALWVVDMYRYMIEHPAFLPANGKAEMKPHERRGEEFGRIYRVIPDGKKLRSTPSLANAEIAELIEHLASPNGTVRDMAHRLLVERGDQTATEKLAEMAKTHELPQARLHALCAVYGLGQLSDDLVKTACRDPHPEIRRHAIRLSESRPALLTQLVNLVDDPSAVVRLQLACSLGEFNEPEAGKALAKIMVHDASDLDIRSAVFSSAVPHFDHLVEAGLENGVLIDELLKIGGERHQKALISRLVKPSENGFQPRQFQALASWLDQKSTVSAEISAAIDQARDCLDQNGTDLDLQIAATQLLGRETQNLAADRERLTELLAPQISSDLKLAVIDALARIGGVDVPNTLLKNWSSHLPRERSRILDVLLQRKQWTKACLAAIEQKTVARGDLDASRRQLLFTHADPEIAKTAKRVLGAGNRQKQIDAYRTALKLDGDQTRGQAVFQKLCASCHLPPEGVPMNGPDLRSITDRSAAGLFGSILDPNQSVDPTYSGYSVTLADGAVLFGRVLSESSNHLTLRLLDGTDRQLSRTKIKSLNNSGLSLMPEGLEAGMTRQDLADVIRFLQTFGRERAIE